MRYLLALVAVAVVGWPGSADAATVKRVRLELGREDNNAITQPIFEASRLPALAIGAVTSRLPAGTIDVTPSGKGRPITFAADIDYASLLREALVSESKAMGFRAGAAGEAAAQVDVRLRALAGEHYIAAFRPVQVFTTLEVEISVTPPGRAAKTRVARVFDYYVGANVEAAMARLFLQAAHQLLAQIARVDLGGVASAAIGRMITALPGRRANDVEHDVYLIGLSGSPDAVPALLGLLPRFKDADTRSAVINGLGLLGAPEAVEPLVGRYAAEDEDCRWFTLKALAAIGGDRANAALEEKGGKDERAACRRLAERARQGGQPVP
jgi:hypothetical protein